MSLERDESLNIQRKFLRQIFTRLARGFYVKTKKERFVNTKENGFNENLQKFNTQVHGGRRLTVKVKLMQRF